MKINIALRTQVLDLLNNGTEKDLNAFPNMSSKKMELIFANRPYSTWIDAVRAVFLNHMFLVFKFS